VNGRETAGAQYFASVACSCPQDSSSFRLLNRKKTHTFFFHPYISHLFPQCRELTSEVIDLVCCFASTKLESWVFWQAVFSQCRLSGEGLLTPSTF
jgi:hypothetical protein